MERRGGQGCSGRLGVLVRARREGAGLTQRELAVRAGVSVGAVRDIEQGRTAWPRPGSLARLAAVLELGGRELEALVSVSAGGRDASAGRPGGEGTAATGLRLAVLGPLAAWRDGLQLPLGPVRERAVLGLLALHHGTGLSRAAMVDALWGQDPPPAAAGMLQGYITRLRRLAGAGSGSREGGRRARDGGAVCWDGTGYRLAPGGIRLDLADFGELAGRARRAAAAGDARRACRLYEQALGMWRGEPLADLDVLRGHPAVTELGRRRVAVVIEYADAAGAAGLHGQALAQLRALAEREPLDERVHARLMAALAATGQQAAALGLYEELRLRLDRELGVRPDRELAEAHVRVLRHEIPIALAAAPAPAPVGVAGGPDRVAPRQLPALGAHFAGRAAELAVLDGLLDRTAGAPGAVVISAIGGTAGVGKTALAVHWAHTVAGRFPDGQLYVDLRGFGPAGAPVAPAEAIRCFLEGLGVAAERIPADPDARAGLYRSLLAGRRMLIVVDNARDAAQVRPLLPASPGCLALVTSRSQLAGLAAADGAYLLTLDVLTGPEAGQLLERRLGPGRVAAEPAAVTELAGLCARLPLALSIAAARAAARPGLPLAALAAELRDARTRLDALGTGDAATDVRTVLSWSCQQLGGPAGRMFRLLGVHPGPDITVPAAASLAGVPLRQARQALAELTRAHLITEHAPGRYSCHDLLRAYAAEQAHAEDSDTSRRAAVHRMLDHYLHTCTAAERRQNPGREPIMLASLQPGVIPESFSGLRAARDWCQAEYAVLMAAINLAALANFGVHAWQITWAMDTSFQWRGHWSDLAAVQETALAAAQRAGDQIGEAHTRSALGRAKALISSFDEAHIHLSRAIDIFQQFGDPAGEARAHIYTGLVAAREGCYTEARRKARQAHELFRLAGNKAGQAGAVNNAGWYSLMLGDYEEALTCCREALRTFREIDDRYGEATALDSLGCTYFRLGNHAEGIMCCQASTDLFAQVGDHYHQGLILTHLGDGYYASRNEQAARWAWQQALKMVGDSHYLDLDELRSKLRSLG
jgi:DNA-binding SARP family transcriptional activator/tetratricopeptide (TPR) repeat protein